MPDANLFQIFPDLSFPIGQVFEVPDQYNGNMRGTWYFRSHFSGTLHGPFMNRDAAQFHLNRDHDCA